MTIRRYGTEENCKRDEVSVWFCDSCNFYHIKAGKTILTFDRAEFSDFANETWNCFYEQEENVFALQ